uniref:Uncharacterized protein n=1 Tax=Brassica oleracea TaxID=3712 RepID=A0A3P6HCF1_BRAOL|nr:unnamed protein product [Brassica oleracea]
MDQIINILLGGLRAAARLISYEIPLTLCVLSISLYVRSVETESLSTVDIVEAQSNMVLGMEFVCQPIGFIIF